MKYLRVNHFWIDDITFAHTCVIGARHFLDNRFSGDFDFGRYDTLCKNDEIISFIMAQNRI